MGLQNDPVRDLPESRANSPNCAESNGRTAEAIKLLEKYLELAPAAIDKEAPQSRIADLKLLLSYAVKVVWRSANFTPRCTARWQSESTISRSATSTRLSNWLPSSLS